MAKRMLASEIAEKLGATDNQLEVGTDFYVDGKIKVNTAEDVVDADGNPIAGGGGVSLYKISVTMDVGPRDLTMTYLSTVAAAPSRISAIPQGNLILVGNNNFNDGDYEYQGPGIMASKSGDNYFSVVFLAGNGSIHKSEFTASTIYISSVEEFH